MNQHQDRVSSVLCDRHWGFHPATWLIIWATSIIFISSLTWPHIFIAFLCVILLLLCFQVSQFLSLCYRSRFLVFMTAIVYAWRIPGRSVFPTENLSFSRWMPTWEGVLMGTEQVTFLLVFIGLVALYLKWLNRDQWIVGLYRVVKWVPFVSGERFAVCFMLILETLGEKPRLSFREWMDCFRSPIKAVDMSFLVSEPVFRVRDFLALGFSILLAGLRWWI